MTTPMNSPNNNIQRVPHTANSPPEIDSFKKLEYIYQQFQDSTKIYESNPDIVMQVPDNTLYPHINNDIEYCYLKMLSTAII